MHQNSKHGVKDSNVVSSTNSPSTPQQAKEDIYLEKISRAQKGDQSAFSYLISEFKNYVYQMEKRYFIPGADREDLHQEGFIGLVHAIKTFQPHYNLSFRDYVSLSIRNSVIRAIRSATQKKQLVLTKAKSIFDKNVMMMKDRENNPETAAMKTLTEERICSIVSTKLSEKEAEILNLKLSGFSSEEIAERMETEKKAVDNALYRARQKIKKFLSSKIRFFNTPGQKVNFKLNSVV